MARRQILSLSERESLLALPDDELTLTRIAVENATTEIVLQYVQKCKI